MRERAEKGQPNLKTGHGAATQALQTKTDGGNPTRTWYTSAFRTLFSYDLLILTLFQNDRDQKVEGADLVTYGSLPRCEVFSGAQDTKSNAASPRHCGVRSVGQ